LCESLLRLNSDFSISPALATPANPDPTTWEYTLRKGVTFWDGRPLTAEDVAYSLNRNLDTKVGSFFANAYRNVDSIKADGDKVIVKLKQPDSLFNQMMATAAGAVVEKSFAEAAGPDLGSAGGGIMGTGPFKFDHWTAGKEIVLTRNDAYWDTSHKAKAGKVTFSFVLDPATQTQALLTGQVEGMYQAPLDGLSKFVGSTSGKIYHGQSLVQVVLLVNKTGGPLSDARVRNALSMALDRTAIAEKLYQGAAQPALRLVTVPAYGKAADVYAAAETPIKPSPDLEGAKELMQEAAPAAKTVTFAYPTGSTDAIDKLATYLQQVGSQLGLEVKLKPMAPPAYAGVFFDPAVREGVDMVFSIWYPDVADPLAVYQNFQTGASMYNYLGYSNADVDTALQAAFAAYDDTARAKATVQAEKQILNDLPWIPIVNQDNMLYMNSAITGAPASFVELYSPWAAEVGAP
jgi:peptide/nickel transport system substrate-binding protein